MVPIFRIITEFLFSQKIGLDISQHRTESTIRLVRPVKTQISLHIHTVWSVFTYCMCLLQPYCMCFLQPQGYPKRYGQEPLPYWVDVQADLFAGHRGLCRFCHALVHILLIHQVLFSPWVSNLGHCDPNSGLSFSKLTMSLVNVSLKTLIIKYFDH